MLDVVSPEANRSQSSATRKIGGSNGESEDDSNPPTVQQRKVADSDDAESRDGGYDGAPRVPKRKITDSDDGESEDDDSDGPPEVRKRKVANPDDGESEQEATEEESSHSDDAETDRHDAKPNALGNGQFISYPARSPVYL